MGYIFVGLVLIIGLCGKKQTDDGEQKSGSVLLWIAIILSIGYLAFA